MISSEPLHSVIKCLRLRIKVHNNELKCMFSLQCNLKFVNLQIKCFYCVLHVFQQTVTC